MDKCPYKINDKIIRCSACKNYGHDVKDCLIKPNEIIINDQNKIPLCKYCNSTEHYLCPFDNDIPILTQFSDNDSNENNKIDYIIDYKVERNSFESLLNFFINEDNKNRSIKNEKRIFKNIPNDEIKNCIFCCYCGDPYHNYTNCPKVNMKIKIKNEFYNNGEYYERINNINEYSKNPLKYEPYQRKEYKIDHHNFRHDYYDQNDSSGESFSEMYKNKNSLNNDN